MEPEPGDWRVAGASAYSIQLPGHLKALTTLTSPQDAWHFRPRPSGGESRVRAAGAVSA